MNIHRHFFTQRVDRTQFLYNNYKEVFQESVLDVGCYEAPLRDILPKNVAYTGIDIAGNPDITLNLEECDQLPFDDNSFRNVICIEVLEHLNRLHFIIDEIFRVAQKEVIISLPNCWASARTPIERGNGSIAHYGLPIEAPIDRHKWFMNVSEIHSFFTNYAQSHPKISSVNLQGVENKKPALAHFYRSLVNPGERYANRFVHTVFAHFKLH